MLYRNNSILKHLMMITIVYTAVLNRNLGRLISLYRFLAGQLIALCMYEATKGFNLASTVMALKFTFHVSFTLMLKFLQFNVCYLPCSYFFFLILLNSDSYKCMSSVTIYLDRKPIQDSYLLDCLSCKYVIVLFQNTCYNM